MELKNERDLGDVPIQIDNLKTSVAVALTMFQCTVITRNELRVALGLKPREEKSDEKLTEAMAIIKACRRARTERGVGFGTVAAMAGEWEQKYGLVP